MVDEADADQFSAESGPNYPDASHAGSFFSFSRDFTILGGNFVSNYNNIINATSPTYSGIRIIPLGDLDLRHEISLDRRGVVSHHRSRGRVRRMYSARLGSHPKTVAVYQGPGAEQEWLTAIKKREAIWHPNILQWCGVARAPGIYATVFHDDLIPFQRYLDIYDPSPLTAVYMYAYFDTEFQDLEQHWSFVLEKRLYPTDCTIWIRCSTGRLCVDPGGQIAHFPANSIRGASLPPRAPISELTIDREAMIISSFTLEGYHGICQWYCSQSYEETIQDMAVSVTLGALSFCPYGTSYEDSTEVAWIPDDCPTDLGLGWQPARRFLGGACKKIMQNGWTRKATDIFWSDSVHSSELDPSNPVIVHHVYPNAPRTSWLTQANSILNRLRMTSDFSDYGSTQFFPLESLALTCVKVVIDWITYLVKFSGPLMDLPAGYLFLCPVTHLQSGTAMGFQFPECIAYWSPDPWGLQRLSVESAQSLGFPAPVLSMQLSGHRWDNTVYAGLRKFHRGRGFDSESQEVARYLGMPLYQFSYK
ncbi:hypothetical protein GGX14DRAFT_388502 [Mycena pura]|uniref:Protein kinase domain-containing protein n=1 Tax=Mycena pura TaxID=153505 RepID=A0AAD6VS82_9AGAR|nr:hypothetical protein GGX14DRAFT_388502 [Mycena pura]